MQKDGETNTWDLQRLEARLRLVEKRNALKDRPFIEKPQRKGRKQSMARNLKLLVWKSSHE